MSLRGETDAFDIFVKTLDDDEPERSIITLPLSQPTTQWPSDGLIVFEQGLSATAPADLWMLDLSNPDSAVAVEYLPSEADLRDIKVSPDGTLAAYTWSSGAAGGQDFFLAARIRREPTPVVLSTDTLFSGDYIRSRSDLHPDGDRIIVAQGTGVSRDPRRCAG